MCEDELSDEIKQDIKDMIKADLEDRYGVTADRIEEEQRRRETHNIGCQCIGCKPRLHLKGCDCKPEEVANPACVAALTNEEFIEENEDDNRIKK